MDSFVNVCVKVFLTQLAIILTGAVYKAWQIIFEIWKQ